MDMRKALALVLFLGAACSTNGASRSPSEPPRPDLDDGAANTDTGWPDDIDIGDPAPDPDPDADTEDTEDTTSDTAQPTNDTSTCPFGEKPDCNGDCYPAYFIGDGQCDDGDPFPSNFNCVAHNYDEGDCAAGDTDAGGTGCGYTVHVRGEAWATEISWRVLDDQGDVVMAIPQGTYTNARDFYHPLRLEDGGFTLEMADAFGDGWHGGYIEILHDASGDIVVHHELSSGGFAEVQFTADCAGVPADTDSDTDPPTDCSDFEVEMQTQSWGNEIGWTLKNSDGVEMASAPEGTYDNNDRASIQLSLPDDIYRLEMTDAFGDGWNGATLTFTDGDGVTQASASLTTGNTGHADLVLQCGDTFNPEIPDTPSNGVIEADCRQTLFRLNTKDWASESSVALWDETHNMQLIDSAPGDFSNNTAYDWPLVLTSARYRVEMMDSFGDGWHGGTWSLVDGSTGDTLIDGGLAGGNSQAIVFDLECTTEGPDIFDHTGGCAEDAIEDCDAICWPESYLGDGNCDDGVAFAANFACAEHNWDNGDCPTP